MFYTDWWIQNVDFKKSAKWNRAVRIMTSWPIDVRFDMNLRRVQRLNKNTVVVLNLVKVMVKL